MDHSAMKSILSCLGGSRSETRYLSVGIVVRRAHEGGNSETKQA